MKALIKSKKMPSDNMVIGIVRTIRIGFNIEFKIDIAKATNTEVINPSIEIPCKIYAASQAAIPDIIILVR